MIMKYKSPQGLCCKIENSYLQLVQRQNRNNECQLRQSQKSPSDTKSFSALQQSDSSDDEDSTNPSTADDSTTTSPTPKITNTATAPSSITNKNNESIDSDITK